MLRWPFEGLGGAIGAHVGAFTAIPTTLVHSRQLGLRDFRRSRGPATTPHAGRLG